MQSLDTDGPLTKLRKDHGTFGPLGIVTTLSKEYSLDAILDACESVVEIDVRVTVSHQLLPLKVHALLLVNQACTEFFSIFVDF